MTKLTSQSKDFSQWYNEIVIMAGLADYSDVRGCMIIKPYGYALWENMQKILDAKIKEMGVENIYMPLFIPEIYFQKEKEHIEGFAPEVAWVTHAGGKKLEERLAIRPTSETIMYRTFSKWVQSYRDLPLKVNQWVNVVRWEMRTRLFLRTAEFLWQEGHTLHANREEADEMVAAVLKMYSSFARDYLAMDVLEGQKTESEKFAGAEYTMSIEAMMRDKKALQMGTSHLLAQNFAKTFEVKFLDNAGLEQTPWPTSWGVSTRMIGGLIMAHGDDIGLIMPPKIAPIQIIIVPIYKNDQEKKKIDDFCELVAKLLIDFKYKVDHDETKSPGWKFSEWEMKGVPLRVEIGPRDVENNQVIAVRRDNGEKIKIGIDEARDRIGILLEDIQKNLFKKNANFLKQNIREYNNYDDFKKDLVEDNFFALVNWCGKTECEEKIKNEVKVTARAYSRERKNGRCLICGQATEQRVYLAKAY